MYNNLCVSCVCLSVHVCRPNVARFQAEGPAGQVIGEISAKANPAALPQVVEAAETLGADLDMNLHTCTICSKTS